MCVPAPRVSYRYRGKTYTVRYCIGVGQTFVEQTHNFPLFLLPPQLRKSATYSQNSQKFLFTQ